MTTTSSTLPIRVDFTCYRGDDWTRMFEPITTAGAVDMTGWTGRMQIRAEEDDTVLLEASSTNGRVTTGPQDNGQGTTWQLMVHLTDTDTATLPTIQARYDIELTRDDGKVATWYHGYFLIEPDITKD